MEEIVKPSKQFREGWVGMGPVLREIELVFILSLIYFSG